MKKMKFIVAILAIGFVVIGSSFAKKATPNQQPYGYDTRTQTSFSPDLYTYHVVNLDEVSGETCVQSSNLCRLTIDITGKTVNEIPNSEFADVLGVNPSTDVSDEVQGTLSY